jgi:hypothetical protein
METAWLNLLDLSSRRAIAHGFGGLRIRLDINSVFLKSTIKPTGANAKTG